MKGTGFCVVRWQMARKYALSSVARSCTAAAGYVLKNCATNASGLSKTEYDWMMEAFAPPFTPAKRSSTRLNQSPVRFLSVMSTRRSW